MAHVDIKTKIGTISLQELCFEKYNFIIPTYQRGYRWRTKHVQALIDDLASIPDDKNYCLQPIVLQKNKNENNFLVVWIGLSDFARFYPCRKISGWRC